MSIETIKRNVKAGLSNRAIISIVCRALVGVVTILLSLLLSTYTYADIFLMLPSGLSVISITGGQMVKDATVATAIIFIVTIVMHTLFYQYCIPARVYRKWTLARVVWAIVFAIIVILVKIIACPFHIGVLIPELIEIVFFTVLLFACPVDKG